jgi:hypothetical protein
VTTDHARFTELHVDAAADVIVGTPGGVLSTGGQLTAMETTFESRVTVVTARIAKFHDVLFDTLTLVVRTLPRTAPADHEFCFPIVGFDMP